MKQLKCSKTHQTTMTSIGIRQIATTCIASRNSCPKSIVNTLVIRKKHNSKLSTYVAALAAVPTTKLAQKVGQRIKNKSIKLAKQRQLSTTLPKNWFNDLSNSSICSRKRQFLNKNWVMKEDEVIHETKMEKTKADINQST